MIDFLVAAAVGLVPVVLFLVALIYLDSYKLLRLRPVILTIVAGGGVALVGWVVNVMVLDRTGMSVTTVARYVAPVVEEILKAGVIVVLIRSHRVGLLVDAAIFGFAVGTGFALVANVHYMRYLADAPPGVWIIRGFGTAIMHGGTAAVFAVVSRLMTERHPDSLTWPYVPGLVLAIGIHSLFNHFFFQPVLSAVLAMLGVPVVLAIVVHRSERFMERWWWRRSRS